jgi:hypothetical protein
MRLKGAFTDGTEAVTAIESPADFALTRQQELWSTACTNPRLTLEFSDGYCPNGRGHSLSFSFGYRELVDGTLHSGNNAVRSEAESPELVVRYQRPAGLTPSGTWGTCEGASGTLIFYGEPTPMVGASMQARFALTLTPCDGSGAAPQIVEGAFNLVLVSSINKACPDNTF